MKKLRGAVCAALVVASASLPSIAQANERHFTYNYETAVLPPGARELELWTTWRAGRENYYSSFDHRIELEIGITERLMTAFYLNFGATTLETEFGRRETTFDYKGVSSEWKYKVSDPTADVLGFGLYGEFSASTSEYEIETKLLFDKYIGNVLLTLNLVGEVEWEVEEDETERELVFAPVAGAMWLVRPEFGVGLELRNHNEVVDGEWEHSALHAGPTAAYRGNGWWSALTFLPQIAALKGSHDGESLVLDEHERIEVRLLLATEL